MRSCAKSIVDDANRRFGPAGSAERKGHDVFELIDKVPQARMPMLYFNCGGEDNLVNDNRELRRL